MPRIAVVVSVCLGVASLAAAPALARSSKGSVTTVNVTAGKPAEFGFKLSARTAKSGVIVFKVTNQGALTHDFKVCSGRNKPLANSCAGRSTKQLSPGQSDTLRITAVLKGTYEYLCTLPGHAASGMKGLIKVT